MKPFMPMNSIKNVKINRIVTSIISIGYVKLNHHTDLSLPGNFPMLIQRIKTNEFVFGARMITSACLVIPLSSMRFTAQSIATVVEQEELAMYIPGNVRMVNIRLRVTINMRNVSKRPLRISIKRSQLSFFHPVTSPMMLPCRLWAANSLIASFSLMNRTMHP
jgi:hypothetical protein